MRAFFRPQRPNALRTEFFAPLAALFPLQGRSVHPVGVEDAVEVIDLVLENDGREASDALRPFGELFVAVAQHDLLSARHFAVAAGNREASLASRSCFRGVFDDNPEATTRYAPNREAKMQMPNISGRKVGYEIKTV